MNLGTATWKLSPSMGVGKDEVKLDSIVVTDGLDGSLEQANVMSSPFLLYAVKGAKLPVGAPKPIIAIASTGGADGAADGGPPPSRSSRSMPPAGGAAARGAPKLGAGAGAGAESPSRSPSRSMSEGGAGAGAESGAGAGAAEAASLLPPPPRTAAAAAACRSFLAKAGMRSSTPARIESSRRSEQYSTERCCSSSDMEPEKALSCSCIKAMARGWLAKRVVSFTKALRVYSFVVRSATGDRITEHSSSTTLTGSGASASMPAGAPPTSTSPYSPTHHTASCSSTG
mmetsp:Transcript_19176/g.60324  ORF Transcript_19176/g.60324 Transcript_19176/m.60324 type:complete len:286 (-) Transcript_19176:1522-2379(-)